MSQRRLLLADDSVTIQKVVNLTFADEGIDVVAVGDGDAAMQKFVEATPDLVMVDVNMPGLDGYRICEMIKQDDETKHIPVILLVGSFEPFDEEEARRVGADDFLTKPFQSIRQLVNKVSNLLNGKKSDAPEDEETVAQNFDDVLEMNSPVEKEIAAENFGDAAMDDEMIQTSQVGSLPIDEVSKFESDSSYQSPEKDDFSLLPTVIDEDSTETSAEADEAETPILTEEYSKEESLEKIEDVSTDDEILPRHENIYEFANEQELAENEINRESPPDSEQQEAANETEPLPTDERKTEDESEAATLAVSAPILRLDEFDLLELPQSKKFKDGEPEISAGRSVTSDETIQTGNLSPEEIEAIADKVVEKLSDQVIKKIVREVFTQMTKKK